MSTTDEQRMHQDEWLAALRSAEAHGTGAEAYVKEPRCVLGRALWIASPMVRNMALDENYRIVQEWLGISHRLTTVLWQMNDIGDSFDDIADWFKAERDAHDGDLSHWRLRAGSPL